jgi:FdrA protein
MTLHALELLADDDDTEVIVVLSKPPDPSVVRAVAEAAGRTGKPVVLGMLGLAGRDDLEVPGNVDLTTSLEGAAVKASRVRLVTHDVPMPKRATPGVIRGLFCGGSLCSEAESVVAGLTPNYAFTDFGEVQWTQGRAHPMIDPAIRNDHFRLAADDPAVGVVLLDVVLGYGAHPDPAGELAPLIEDALRKRGDLTVVVSLCGTVRDPQDSKAQRDGLRASGALVSHNAAHAARLAGAAGGYS